MNNTNDLFIRNFLFGKARILAVVGLHGNTFKPHTGTKTSVVFLQKYTREELDEIRAIENRHAAEWDNHLAELTALSEKAELTEEDLPPLLFSFLQAEFEEGETSDNGEGEAEKAAAELDYPIFFAVSEKAGKDNSGDPIYKKDENGELLLDEHGHLIVDHDLDEIAEAFIAFAKERGFDFWAEG